MTNAAGGQSNLPQADVSNGALADAVVALLLVIMRGETDLAVYGPAATVVFSS